MAAEFCLSRFCVEQRRGRSGWDRRRLVVIVASAVSKYAGASLKFSGFIMPALLITTLSLRIFHDHFFLQTSQSPRRRRMSSVSDSIFGFDSP